MTAPATAETATPPAALTPAGEPRLSVRLSEMPEGFRACRFCRDGELPPVTRVDRVYHWQTTDPSGRLRLTHWCGQPRNPGPRARLERGRRGGAGDIVITLAPGETFDTLRRLWNRLQGDC